MIKFGRPIYSDVEGRLPSAEALDLDLKPYLTRYDRDLLREAAAGKLR